ncbi:MAG TPA: AbrB/MazE/SpoVT family DNA-binding domain-containing protein [Candidatus Saccharimonadales bacterium]|nr:AbrB/MazE/SpoVT family DNA-binding domain-containing protein [Candidatus Saccharimonadales bacterium]
MKAITLSSKNQVVIPSSVRKKLGVKSGDKLIVVRLSDKEVVLKKAPSYGDLVGTLPSQKQDAVHRIREQRSNWQ